MRRYLNLRLSLVKASSVAPSSATPALARRALIAQKFTSRGLIARFALGAALVALAGCGGGPTTTGPGGTPAANAPAPAPPPPIEVPVGTVISVTIDQSISTKTSVEGNKFPASVAEPVVVNGREAIPQGTKAVGHVTVSDQAGRVKGGARLAVALDSVTVNGQSVPVRATSVIETGKGRGERTGIGAGGGAAAGAIIGAIAGGGKGALIGAGAGAGAGTAGAAFTGNRDITIPAETRLNFRLTDPLDVPQQ
jgi:hypothetical protein